MLDRPGPPAQALRHDRIALRLYEQAGHRADRPMRSTRSAGCMPCSGTTTRPSITAGRRWSCTVSSATAAAKPRPWTASATRTTTSGGTAKSVACCRKALGLFRELGDRYYEAEVLAHLGDAYHVAGDPGQRPRCLAAGPGHPRRPAPPRRRSSPRQARHGLRMSRYQQQAAARRGDPRGAAAPRLSLSVAGS